MALVPFATLACDMAAPTTLAGDVPCPHGVF
jgi:hypothetical protein